MKTLRITILLYLLLLFAPGTCQIITGQSPGYHQNPMFSGAEKDIEAVKGVLEQLYSALGERNVEKYAAATAPGYYVLEDGEYWSLEYILSRIGNADKTTDYTRRDRMDYKLLEVYDRTAFAVWELYTEVIKNGDTRNYHWLESASFKKIEGKWKVYVLHSTVIEK